MGDKQPKDYDVNPYAGALPAGLRAAMELQEALRSFTSPLDGEVAHLKSNGWTDEQARAIVSYMFGWRPQDGSKPEGVD